MGSGRSSLTVVVLCVVVFSLFSSILTKGKRVTVKVTEEDDGNHEELNIHRPNSKAESRSQRRSAPHSIFVTNGMDFHGMMKDLSNPPLTDAENEIDRKPPPFNEKQPSRGAKQLTLPPVVLVPGSGGSQITAKLNKTTSRFFCKKQTKDFYRIWLDIFELVPGAIDCFDDNFSLRLVEREGSQTYADTPEGVTMGVVDFGGTDGVEYLDPRTSYSVYFGVLVNRLKSIGYQPKKSLRAAPYDFRFAPETRQGEEYIASLKTLIEETFESNNQQRVVLISHSYGSLMSVYLMTYMTREWCDKYISGFISLSGAFAGSPGALAAVLSGDTFGIPFINRLTARPTQRTFQSNYVFFPRPDVFGEDQVFVSTPLRNFTSSQFDEMFSFFNLTFVQKMYQVTSSISTFPKLKPNLSADRFFCLHGSQVDTIFSMNYPSLNLDIFPQTQMVDGDGTIPRQSLRYCQKWGNVHIKEFPGVIHSTMPSNETVINAVIDIIHSLSSYSP